MIVLTRLDGKELVVNCDHILTVEATPDTVLLLTNGDHFMVKEPPQAVMEKVAAWRRRCQTALPELVAPPERAAEILAFPRSVPSTEE